MNTLQKGEQVSDRFLLLLKIALRGHSLAKIYTGLCECCAKPVEDCKRTTERKSQQIARNRYAPFKLGTMDTCCECESELACDSEGVGEDFTPAPQVDDTPQLIDDPLGDAFEIRRESQVHLPSLL